MEKFNTSKTILYASGEFVVHECTMYDFSLNGDILGYGIYNTTTGIREAEVRRLYNAKIICDYIANFKVPSKDPKDYVKQLNLPLSVN